MKTQLPPFVYKIAIVLATVMWGAAFPIMKNVVQYVPTCWLFGIRFLLAGGILAIFLRKRIRKFFSRKVFWMGIALAIADFSAFLTQTIGLTYTTSGVNAFLTALYCVIVPFLWWLIAHRAPSAFNIVAAVLAVIGVWFVSGSAGSFNLGFGEGLTLVCAVLFAVHIVLVSKFSESADALTLTAVQFLGEGVLGCAFGAGFETLPAFSAFTPEIVGQILFLAVFATVFAFGVQNVSLAHIPPAQVSLLLSLESVFGVVFGILLAGDVLTLRLVVGFAFIFVAIFVSETLPSICKTKAKKLET